MSFLACIPVKNRLLVPLPLERGLHLLISVRLGTGGAAEPLVVAAARDLQELTHATYLELGVLLLHPGVLYGSCCAKSAAAFFKMSRVSDHGVNSLKINDLIS